MRHFIPGDLSALLRAGLWRSVGALAIKVATAGLTFVTYVVLSRAMAADAYGQFALGLSLATIAAVLAGAGQQTAVLRLYPERTAAGDDQGALAAIRSGSGVTLLGGLGTGLVIALGALAWQRLVPGSGDIGPYWAAAVLVLPLAFAEFQSSALRAQGSVWTALAPRDLLWRVALPVSVWALASFGLALDGTEALLLAAAILAATLLGQAMLATAQKRVTAPAFRSLPAYWQGSGAMSWWFLAGALIDVVALNADTLLVGVLLDEAAAGTYFNASRTAGLMTLFMYAATLVIAPMLARHFHAGNRRKAQAITALSAWAGFGFALATFVIFALWGRSLLELFGPGYGEGHGVLMLLSIGLLFDAATGSSRTTMMMTGHERAYVAIAGTATTAGLALILIATPAFGLVGAAATAMAVRIASQIGIALYCQTRIGIDPTIFGPLRLRLPRSEVPA